APNSGDETPEGTIDLGNKADGVFVHGGANATVGGTAMADRNVISGNTGDGVEFNAAGANNVVEGNFIGTDAAGDDALANGGQGVHVLNTAAVTIGGTAVDAGNVISGNTM